MSIVTDESNDVAVNGPAVVEIDAERIAWATNLIRGPSKSDQGDMNFDVIAERRAALRRILTAPRRTIMTIFALCCFAFNCPTFNPDAAAEALRAAGFKVYRLPPLLKVALEFPDDFLEIRRDDDSREAMEADAERIVSLFGGAIDPSDARTIAELWGYSEKSSTSVEHSERPSTSVESDDAELIPFFDDDDEDIEMWRREALNHIESAIADLRRARGRIPEANVNVNEVERLTRVVAHCAEEAVQVLAGSPVSGPPTIGAPSNVIQFGERCPSLSGEPS
jgi:hypothetical protein